MLLTDKECAVIEDDVYRYRYTGTGTYPQGRGQSTYGILLMYEDLAAAHRLSQILLAAVLNSSGSFFKVKH